MKRTHPSSSTCCLRREDWDFSKCPEGREYACWAYEYARESPSIIARYKKYLEEAIANDQRAESVGFDEFGNWHYQVDLYDSSGEVEDVIVLELPPGFPFEPYLRTKHKRWKPNFKFRGLSGVHDAKRAGNWAKEYRSPEYFAHLHILWQKPDKKLISDFATWLKENRPFPPISRRGKAVAKTCMADLKALGAYRLLKHFTAREADSRVRKNNCVLYQKMPDWYEAKARAEQVMKNFR